MTAADILKECGFSSAEEVAALDGKFPGSNGNIGTGNNSTLQHSTTRAAAACGS